MMKYTTKRNISLTIVLILVGAALGVFFGLDWPAFKKIGELNGKIAQEKIQYQDQYEAVQIAKSIINQYKSLSGVSQTISLSVPREAEIQNIIAQINNVSLQAGLTTQSVNFESVTVTQPKKDVLVKNNQITRIDISLLGSYESFKTWLSAVEGNIRLMDIEKISFSGISGSDSTKNQGMFNFKVSLNVYYQ
ncbi:MAG TPA: type 4a pilus biogenesis protein PilO [Candidatus Paceibacterota bacterium]|nr:type 4a pilus biogenesis protein PilO [Candidatus Paceibacterota bacterium]HPT40388.1 type 4a pilus biogenesis protein PilO [Candidatus Paceibacterota bacterium]